MKAISAKRKEIVVQLGYGGDEWSLRKISKEVNSDPRVMRIVLEVCTEKGLFFLDSRTSGRRVIGKLSREKGIKQRKIIYFMMKCIKPVILD